MNRIGLFRLGFAVATTSALLYAGCMLVLLAAGPEGATLFFNSILHGIDVSPILRPAMPWWEMLLGIAEVFVIGWLTGALIASLYNLFARSARR